MKKRQEEKRICEALVFAAKAHNGQPRKGTDIPYIVHPVGAALALMRHGAPVKAVMAALLHDTLEDTKVSHEELESSFGKDVARLVKYATEPDRTKTWEERKLHTIELVKGGLPGMARLVICADKLDNIRAIHRDYERCGESLWKRFNRPKRDQEWYYRSLATAFSIHKDNGGHAGLFKEFISEVDATFGKGRTAKGGEKIWHS